MLLTAHQCCHLHFSPSKPLIGTLLLAPSPVAVPIICGLAVGSTQLAEQRFIACFKTTFLRLWHVFISREGVLQAWSI